MSFINLRKVVYFNFRTLQGLHQIEFANNGLVAIKGVNLDTKGRSGAGKTNVILGIAYLFGHCPHPATTLQCWYDEDPFYVEGHFDTSAGPAILVRGSKGMSLQVGTEKKLTGSKAVEERLDRLCGVRGDLREILTYRDQKKPQKFLGMKDSELKEFLALVLGLTDLDKQIDASTKKLSVLEKQVTSDVGALKTWEDVRGDRKDVWTELPPVGVSYILERQVLDAATAIEASKKVENEVRAQLIEARKQEDAAAKAAGMSNAKDVKEKGYVVEAIRAKLQNPPDIDREEEFRIAGLLEEARKHITDLNQEDGKKYVEYRKGLEEINNKINETNSTLGQQDMLLAQRKRLIEQRDALALNNCSMCGKQWDEAAKKLDETIDSIRTVNIRIDKTIEAEAELEKLKEELASCVWNPDPKLGMLKTVEGNLRSQLAVEQQKQLAQKQSWEACINQEISEANGSLKEAVAKGLSAAALVSADPNRRSLVHEKVLAQVKDDIIQHGFTHERALSRLAAAQKQHKADEDSYELRHAVYLADLQKDKKYRSAALTSASAWNLESDYLDMLKGFRNKIFDESLEEIGTESTRILGELPNAQHISIEFKSERSTAAGTIRNEIKPIAYLHGEERPLASSVSGGQFTSVELAVDLAVSSVISRRLGCQLNWLILDESFAGHDQITKEACLTLLRQYASDKLVLIVDHSSEFMELFTQEIIVNLEDKKSSIQVPGAP